jgi:hypothetical protein
MASGKAPHLEHTTSDRADSVSMGKLKGFCTTGDSCAFRIVGGHSRPLIVEIHLSFDMSLFHLVRGPVLSYPN